MREIAYPLEKTCAADGLCGIACPVGIDTGRLVKELRQRQNGLLANWIADAVAARMAVTTSLLRGLLPLPHHIARIAGYGLTEYVAGKLHRLSRGRFPLWTRHTPPGSRKITRNIFPADIPGAPAAVYFPACVTRAMGGAPSGSEDRDDVSRKMLSILRKAGYTVIIPEGKDRLCCGMAFASKGFRKQARRKERELNEALLKASRNGELPVVCDMSPCLLQMRETLDKRLKLYDQAEFIHDFLLDRLSLVRQPVTVAIHLTCSSRKMRLEEKLLTVASLCAERVIVPDNVGCCGWAGDRGFFYPELNRSALAPLKREISTAQVSEGYSNSRTCETGLSMNSGIPYKSLVYLVDRAILQSP